jgi:transcriptional regulator with XRE-family HTH domain
MGNMQLNTSYKEELLKNLEDPEYRKSFVETHINNGIAFQIRTMRHNRKLKQEDLGKLAGMKQEAICRIENPNYGNFTLNTLKEIAAAFNVALMVRFIPFGDLIKWDLNLSSKSLEVPSYDQDSYFKENNSHSTAIADSNKYQGISNQEALDNVVYLKNDLLHQQQTDLADVIYG